MSLITPRGWEDTSIHRPEKPTLHISKLLMRQIQDMCTRTPQGKEWSGPFFYKEIEGDISKPESFALSGEFLYPMDIGSSAYTEYEILPRPGTNKSPLVKWAMQHVIGKKLQLGHIHSHHNMAVWFSGTDQDELEGNAQHHNYYLSLIVNNKYEMTARIGILLEAEVEQELSFFKKVTKNFTLSHSGETYKKKVTQLMWYDVDIKVPEVTPLPAWYMNAFQELVKSKVNDNPLANVPKPGLQDFQHQGVQTRLFNQAQKPFVWEADEEKTAEDLLIEMLSFDIQHDSVADAISGLKKTWRNSLERGTSFQNFCNEEGFYITSNFEEAYQHTYPNQLIDPARIQEVKEIVDDMKADKITVWLSSLIEKLINEYTS